MMDVTMSPPDEDGIVVVTLGGDQDQAWGTPQDEHRLNPDSCEALELALDAVEADVTATALVFRGEGKFFCNGIDMAWIDYQETGEARAGGALQQLSPKTASHPIWSRAERLLARLLTFPLPTAAAINGHWVAWGCMLGLAFDYRVMREDRGFMFVPAVDIGAM